MQIDKKVLLSPVHEKHIMLNCAMDCVRVEVNCLLETALGVGKMHDMSSTSGRKVDRCL